MAHRNTEYFWMGTRILLSEYRGVYSKYSQMNAPPGILAKISFIRHLHSWLVNRTTTAAYIYIYYLTCNIYQEAEDHLNVDSWLWYTITLLTLSHSERCTHGAEYKSYNNYIWVFVETWVPLCIQFILALSQSPRILIGNVALLIFFLLVRARSRC